MPKISQLPEQDTPTITDKAPIVSGGITNYATLANLITLFFNNIPTGNPSPTTRASEQLFNHVASGGVWTGDSYGTNRNASMTALVCYINGRRIAIGAVTARTFTASKDTYIDVLDNADGTGTLVYTEVANNAASPALASNSIRIGIIVTGATTIANVGSVNQGQENKVLPIVSSVAYAVTDSLGNLICPSDPNRKLLGQRQFVVSVGTGTTAETLITGLNCPVIVPAGRKIKVTMFSYAITISSGVASTFIYEGIFGSGGVQIQAWNISTTNIGCIIERTYTPTSLTPTFTATISTTAANPTVNAAATLPVFLRVELS